MRDYEEMELSNGTLVRVVEVPFMLGLDIVMMQPELDFPDVPMEEVKTITGSEMVEMPPDSDEYKAYLKEAARIESARNRLQQNVPWDEGVLAWKAKDDKRWQTEPPDDYQLPRTLAKMGGFSPYLDNRRIAYIRYEVLKNNDDYMMVFREINKGLAITQEEVDAAVDGFQGDAPRQQNEESAGE